MNTIEQNLQRMADALELIAAALQRTQSVDVPHHPSPVDTTALFAAIPPQLPVAEIVPPVAAPVAIPFPEVAVAPVVAPVPFNNVEGLRSYIVESFQTLEAATVGKGILVKNVMVSLGYSRVDDVPLTAYDALYRGVQAVLQS